MNNIMKKKRLGQFFSGEKVSNLLAAFIDKKTAMSIIDPMCGVADMLIAAGKVNPAAELFGIDIDEEVTKKIKEITNLNNNPMQILTGSAFSEKTINQLPKLAFDLVITNPPYVRYQSFSEKQKDIPSSEEVRHGLLNIIALMDHLDIKDKEIFSTLTKGYSGLSDLAVPSWILCAMLTKVGGQLAMVVPESWLNRDYAHPINYLLLKFFNIEYVVEDLDRSWFRNTAQVKTNLIIATRVPRIEKLWSFYENKFHYHIGLTSEYDNEKSFLGRLYPESIYPESEFFLDLRKENIQGIQGIEVRKIELRNKLEKIFSTSKETKWFNQVEEKEEFPIMSIPLPNMLKEIIPFSYIGFKTLEDIGVEVGQGLRTGANKFFYVDYLNDSNTGCIIKPNDEISTGTVHVPSDSIRKVIRKQNELPSGYCLDEKKLIGRVLILNNYIHPSDIEKIPHQVSSRNIMSKNLSELINIAEKVNFGNEQNPKFIPNYSAVKPNVKKVRNQDLDTASFWYMLPKFSARHLPDIFVARVNGKSPKFYINPNPKVIVDANFSGLWIKDAVLLNKYSLLALLNSEWILLCCEMTGTVMGGGALKVEATHLKKIPIPNFSKEEYNELTSLGKKLMSGEDELEKVNTLIAKNIFKEDYSYGKDKIKKILQNKLAYREKG